MYIFSYFIRRKTKNFFREINFRKSISDSILTEIEKILKEPKFKLNKDFFSIVISEIESIAQRTVNISLKDDSSLRDRDDYHILESAISAKVDYLITGIKIYLF
ncbi:putative toxin-antitoxin system toxin component, PIN family [Leptospira interrogans]|uniref:putative toxin-antitoxin system toxin component, PIN family n=1 Tax=Leptospira interrogans TaxID=173 RepID=UPI0003088F67|nr:putative toxin-antitoxin system toxin component, PIN family [Leptospira interrogans]MCH5432621.1 putative toxin-antitoxin system toxin component, PIN family [Leptospira interrogans serovar Canicola]MCR8626542.1 putative toxin-antitoxin system toxin component, PIN family [Leptospira interrogans serovar Canicola]